MRRLTKLMTLVVVALVASLAMAGAAWAAADYSITINNGKAGETYTAYKMLDLSVDDPENPTAYRYTVNSAWTAFAETDEFKAVYTVDSQGYVTSQQTSEATWSASSALSALAEKAAAYAKTNNIAAAGSVTIAEGATSGKINLTGAGYYVISSTLGSRAMIETTPANPGATVNEKNSEDTVEKTVKEDSTGAYGESNDAQVGDTVEFKTVATIVPRSINVKIHDTMDSGLTLNTNSIKVYTDAALTTEYTAATIKTGAQAAQGDTFTIEIPDAFAATASANQNLYIVYTAEVNDDAVVKDADGVAIVDQNNKTKVSFGDGTSSTEDTTTTTTHKFEVLKHAGQSKANLADAIFQLKKGDAVVNLIKLDATNYRIADDTEAAGTATTHVADNNEVATVADNTLVSDFVTVGTGNIVIWGVDSDSDYKLHEVQAPKGYNLLGQDKNVTVDAQNNTVVDVENNTGAELPSTGGIGTTILYIIGAVLVIGAGVFLVTKRRMRKEDNVQE